MNVGAMEGEVAVFFRSGRLVLTFDELAMAEVWVRGDWKLRPFKQGARKGLSLYVES